MRRFVRSEWSVLLAAGVLAAFLFGTPAIADTVVYSQGFESDNGGYTGDSNVQWQWGAPTNVGPSSAHAGTNCWGTDLSGNVSATNDGYLGAPVVALPSLGASQVARVSFWAWTDMGGMYDRGEFFVSSDGSNWQSLATFYEQMAGGWQRYEFDVSSYTDGNIYFRWRLFKQDDASPGFYIDDVAVTYRDVIGDAKVFTLEGWEDGSSGASCPWVFPWDGSDYAADNDIYSVARGPSQEYTDYYLLERPLVAQGSNYSLEIREVAAEDSWTDLVGLIAVDHAEGVGIAPDDKGNIFGFTKATLIAPVTATLDDGTDVTALLASEDDTGVAAYSEDTVAVDFGTADLSGGARVYLRVKGFRMGTGSATPYIGPPAIVVQVSDGGGGWTEIGRLKPRFEWAEGMFDLSPFVAGMGGEAKIRLLSISHAIKYHEIDRVALAIGAQPETITQQLPLVGATAGTTDVLALLSTSDDQYVELSQGNKFSVTFDAAEASLPARSFVFVSEGYYVPKGSTFLVYTWDGSGWAQRDGWSTSGDNDVTMAFDLTPFLPDPNGAYKVRVWQDYTYEPARIDFAQMAVGATTGTLSSATDLRGPTDVLSSVSASDDSYLAYDWGGERDRWTEYDFTGFAVNVPPSTSPVTVVFAGATCTINWTYFDTESAPQAQYEVEVWTGPGATGTIMWDPAAGSGTATSVDYGGAALTTGMTYYARVRASDGSQWGAWSEVEFEAGAAGEGGAIPTVNGLGAALLAMLIAFAAVALLWRNRFGL